MNLLAQTALLVALTSLGMGLSVLPRQLQNKLLLSFSGVCAVVFSWSLLFFLEQVFGGGWFYYFHLLSGIWLGPASLLFIRIWIGRFPEGWIRLASRGIWWLSWIASGVLTVLWLLSWERGGVDPSFLRDLMLFAPAPVVLQLLIILSTRRPLPIREGVVFGGALLVLSFSTLDHVPWLGHVAPSVGNLLLCTYMILLGQAIRQQKFLDLPFLVMRFLVLLVLAVLLTALYLLLVAWVKGNPVLLFLNSFAASFVVMMLLGPLQRWVSVLISRLLRSRDLDWKTQLERSRLLVNSARDLGEWEQAVLEGLRQAVSPVHLKMVLLNRDPADRSVLVLEEIEKRRAQSRSSILVDTLLMAEMDRTASASQRARLQALLDELRGLGFSSVFPIFDRKIMGWVLVQLVEVSVEGAQGGFRTWRQLRDVEAFLIDAGKSLELILRVRDEAERERLATLGEMAAGLAHEIRNPLGAIQGAAQLLPESADAGPWTRVIREEVARLNHVVSQFLLYSKKPSLEVGSVNVDQWMNRSIERLNAALFLSRSGTVAKVRLTEPSWNSIDRRSLRVDMDSEAIFQVLENLTRNSVEAGATEITISAGVPEGSEGLLLEVRDNGKGIQPENLNKLFVPFFTTHPSGTGLGLSISQRIMENHRGRIEAVVVQGAGACFRLRLPLKGEA